LPKNKDYPRNRKVLAKGRGLVLKDKNKQIRWLIVVGR
jgi:hypothetical protein